MVINKSNNLSKYWPGLALVVGLVSCASDPYYAGPSAHARQAYYYPYEYYYYPAVRVYFNYPTEYYYYPSGSSWKRTKELPPAFRLDQRDRKIIRTDNHKPYSKHYEHQNRYQPHPDYRPDVKRDRAERKHHEKPNNNYRDKQK